MNTIIAAVRILNTRAESRTAKLGWQVICIFINYCPSVTRWCQVHVMVASKVVVIQYDYLSVREHFKL